LHVDTDVDETLSEFLVVDFHCFLEVVLSGGNQGLLGPGQEPVNSGTVDQGWEGSQSSSEVLSDGRHADNHVEVALTELHEFLIFFVEGADG